MYEIVNRSPTRYGYYRLDAFGRIYNRVLEHIVTQDQLNEAMEDLVKEGKLSQQQLDELRQENKSPYRRPARPSGLPSRTGVAVESPARVRNKLFNTPMLRSAIPFYGTFPSMTTCSGTASCRMLAWGRLAAMPAR